MYLQFATRGAKKERLLIGGVDSSTWSWTTHGMFDQPAQRLLVGGLQTSWLSLGRFVLLTEGRNPQSRVCLDVRVIEAKVFFMEHERVLAQLQFLPMLYICLCVIILDCHNNTGWNTEW